MSFAITLNKIGGPEVLHWEAIHVGHPGPEQIRLRHTAIGLNFIDIYHRTGLYAQPLPFVPGVEAAGVIEAIGSNVANLKVGDRVAYALVIGAYSEERLIAADRVVKIPDGISDADAAAMMLKGMTAQYLLRRVHRVTKDDTILVHAAAGGVGLIMCLWASHLGATVIGTVSTEAKAELARANGCTHAITTNNSDFVARVKEITGGKGLPVVYDSVGRDTFHKSLACLKPRGTMVLFGQASGAVEPIDPNILQRGSLFLTRPTLGTYIASRSDLEETASELFNVVASGAVKIEVKQRYRLRDAGLAHRDLEARKTTGSTVFDVNG
ncbi:MAG: quinone oxidoreductase [Pseudomonadota bacterium]|nr:quinone oxidoreductase [Pseudomonadota bacterium]